MSHYEDSIKNSEIKRIHEWLYRFEGQSAQAKQVHLISLLIYNESSTSYWHTLGCQEWCSQYAWLLWQVYARVLCISWSEQYWHSDSSSDLVDRRRYINFITLRHLKTTSWMSWLDLILFMSLSDNDVQTQTRSTQWVNTTSMRSSYLLAFGYSSWCTDICLCPLTTTMLIQSHTWKISASSDGLRDCWLSDDVMTNEHTNIDSLISSTCNVELSPKSIKERTIWHIRLHSDYKKTGFIYLVRYKRVDIRS